uniref:Secreted protein n=1 Tax=Pyxicephalus adspersus TaxID=30357 RepID=A0AAV3B686_PYXAD|nr:TPA: hypothetical protein GDO54_007266 [Pyxicephalus adspersus]
MTGAQFFFFFKAIAFCFLWDIPHTDVCQHPHLHFFASYYSLACTHDIHDLIDTLTPAFSAYFLSFAISAVIFKEEIFLLLINWPLNCKKKKNFSQRSKRDTLENS